MKPLSWKIYEWLEQAGMFYDDVRDDLGNVTYVVDCAAEVVDRINMDRINRDKHEAGNFDNLNEVI